MLELPTRNSRERLPRDLSRGTAWEARSLSPHSAPRAGHGQVVVRVQAAVNPTDVPTTNGDRRARSAATLPVVRRTDVAGTVERVGDGATRFAPGERIFGQVAVATLAAAAGNGEHLAVADDAPLARVPAGLDLAVAAALPTAGMTGLALVESLGPLKGKTIVIVGAGGLVGAFATQFAVDGRARVIVNVEEEQALQMLALGVVDTIDDAVVSLPHAVANRGRIDALIDLSSDAVRFAAIAAAVRPYGIALSTRGVVDGPTLDAAAVTGINFQLLPSAGLLERFADALATGRVVLPPSARTGLDQASAA